jgi:hypothetical protein
MQHGCSKTDTMMNVLTAYNKHQLTVKVMTGDKQN